MNTGRRLALALLAPAILAACGQGPVGASHRPTVQTLDSTRALLEIEQLWWRTGASSGAYGYVFNLEETPSLDATAWHLRVAAQLHAPLPYLSKAETAAWLSDVIDSDTPPAGMTHMEAIELATQALVDLGAPIPSVRLRADLERLRAGGLYGSEPGSTPSWSATVLAATAYRAAGLQPPADLPSRIEEVLASSTSVDTPNDWLNLFLPRWELADELLPAAKRAPYRAALEASLARLAAVARGAPMNGVTLFVMAEVTAIARANSLTGLDFPASSWQSLVTPDGYLGAAPDDPRPSLQSTAYALMLGYRPPRQLLDYLRYSAAPRGWRDDVGPPDVKASYYALMVSRALGGRGHEEALRSQANAWLDEVETAFAHPEQRATFDGAYFALALARALRMPVPPAVQRGFADLVESHEPDVADGAVPSLARIAALLAYRPGPSFEARLRANLRTLDLGHMPEAVAALAIASCLDDAALRERVGSAVRALGAGGLFLDRAGAPYPDLRSTALGALATAIHRPVGEVQTTFADRRGVWLLPVRQAQGNVVDLGTLYFGLWLMGDVSDPAGVV